MAIGSGAGAASISSAAAPTGPGLRFLWAFLGVFFAVWIARILLIPWTDAAADQPSTVRLIADLWRLAIWLLLPLVWLIRFERVDPRAAIDQRPGERPWLGVALGLGYLTAARLYDVAMGAPWIAIPNLPVPTLAASIVGIAFAALCEEFLFRGVLLKEFTRRYGFGRANFLQAVLFVAIQWPAWIALIEFDPATFALLSGLAMLYALLLVAIVRQTGTIWIGFGVQTLGNALQGLGFGA
jgi:membrane protease YdiL (CAAX protease family)